MILALVAALRPKQWTKNLLLFAGVLFSQQLNHPALVLRAAIGFLAFSLLAGCTYLFNDLRDVSADRLHPRKRNRPIASGRLPERVAWGALFPLLLVALSLCWWLGTGFMIAAGIYVALNLAYSLGLRNLVLIDVFIIALGFVLRAIAGVELLRGPAPGTELSPWLLVCTFFGALFLGLSKRRRELANAGDVASTQRRVLDEYSPELLDGLLTVSAAASLMGYALYTIWPSTVAKFGTEAMLYTIPFVAYGIFRYLYLLRVSEHAEDPSLVLLTDRPMAWCVVRGALPARCGRDPVSRVSPARGSRAARVRHGAVTLEARAKINLGLAIGPSRADGFHELVTVFQSVSLSDTLTVRPKRRGFTLKIRFEEAAARGSRGGEARTAVPTGPENLVLRAARLLAERFEIATGAEFELVKRIPVRAGLGGGSADAAAALVGFAAIQGLRLSREQRITLGAELGSDVPFAMLGGTALGRGRGERLTLLRLARPFRALIAVPKWGISTAEAFRSLDARKNHLTQWNAILRSAQILGVERVSADRAMRLGNTFELVLGRRQVAFTALKQRLEAAGATFVHMTGSGSAVVGLLPDGRAGTDAVRRFQGTEALYLVHSVGRGLKLNGRS